MVFKKTRQRKKGKTISSLKSTLNEKVMKLLIEQGAEKFKKVVEVVYNEAMKIERSQILEVAPYEHSITRKGYANGYIAKGLLVSTGN